MVFSHRSCTSGKTRFHIHTRVFTCPEQSFGLDDVSMAITTSTLSELTRTPTPPSNGSDYRTASEGTAASASVTEPSSPADDSKDDAAHHRAAYRDALGLPRELRLRCQIHLEEQCCENNQ